IYRGRSSSASSVAGHFRRKHRGCSAEARVPASNRPGTASSRFLVLVLQLLGLGEDTFFLLPDGSLSRHTVTKGCRPLAMAPIRALMGKSEFPKSLKKPRFNEMEPLRFTHCTIA
ncbi:MAG: hypothetical protein ACM3U2_04460, partial [Deltaproteobacteria bacterium]